MGTRNITRVICDGSVAVEQYCQWDGYPTGHGLEVLLFVKNYCDDMLESFREKLMDSSLYMHKRGGGCTYTGAPYIKSIFNKVGKLDGAFYESASSDVIEKAVKNGDLTVEEASVYLTASRDTGSYVLYWLMRPDVKRMVFYTDQYLSEINDDLDWQIEGLYTINVDEKWVEINYHGYKRRYDFEDVFKMSEQEITDEMKDMEKKEGDEDE